MEMAYSLVRNLVVIIVLAAMMEMIIPSGSFKPLLGFIMGLFVLIAVLQPVAGILHRGEMAWDNWNLEAAAPDVRQLQKESETMRQDILQQVEAEMSRKLSNQIAAMTLLVPGVEEAQAEVDLREGQHLEGVRLEITLEPEPAADQPLAGSARIDEGAVRSKVCRVLQQVYGVEEDQIQIEFRGRR
jgi:stage III sporulation protein AF